MIVLAALALAAAAPSAEAEGLGVELAQSGTVAALLPLAARKDIEELVAAHAELSDSDKAALRRSAERTFQAGRAKLMAATGHAYAERLTVAELRTLVAFNRSPAAKHYREAMPEAIMAAMQTIGSMDFKKDSLAAFCRDTGKLCEAR